MSTTFYIVDDDRTVHKILERIITDQDLGTVIGSADDGSAALPEIQALRPDVVLVDLLLPGLDGITLVDNCKPVCPQTCFIMLSQVADKDMVSKAYLAGVDFFINKPPNMIEVVSVIGQVRERMTMRSVLHSLRATIGALDSPASRVPADQSEEETRRRVIRSVLAKLGILGESGSEDITEICMLISARTSGMEGCGKMNQLYFLIAKKYADHGVRLNAASVEQRVRRAIIKALNNTANLGLEDYANEFFVEFGSSFFEFSEVRQQMNYLRGTSNLPGKINVRKFIEGLHMHIQDGSAI